MTYIWMEVSKARRGPRKKIRLLVDTGAADSILPGPFLRRLGVRPEWREEYELANGESMFREAGRMYIHHQGRSVETLVAFGEPGDASVLGAYSMEGLRLEVDPHSGRVRRKGKLLAVAAA
jgi:predicted aspartyl protease